jgi:hypothetical protein
MIRRVGMLLAAVVVAACGDLVIPTNDAGTGTGDDGGGPSGDDGSAGGGGGGGDDGAAPDSPAVDAFADAGPPDCTNEQQQPVDLACTGLYSDWTTLTVSPDVQAYTPGLALWADSADESRWIYLPPNTKIDTSNLNEWNFPVGTKFWQEFRLFGKQVETRFLWKVGPVLWFRTTYQWTADLAHATELTSGATNVSGVGYEIPSTDQCATCHSGRIDFVLGFELVSLALPQSNGLNLTQLKQKALISQAPTNTPVIPGPDLTSAGALGFLHANCGTSCHNSSPSSTSGTTLLMRLNVDSTGALPSSEQATDTWTTAVNVVSTLAPVGQDAGSLDRIKPGDAANSMVTFTAGRRDGIVQMPPLATHVVDTTDVATLTSWINEIP